jgi:hypothetical protein
MFFFFYNDKWHSLGDRCESNISYDLIGRKQLMFRTHASFLMRNTQNIDQRAGVFLHHDNGKMALRCGHANDLFPGAAD